MSASLAALATGRPLLSVLLGTVAGALDDAGAFRRETLDALRASGRDGTFDPVGWALTGIALVASVLVVAWAATTLARAVRTWTIRALGAAAGALRTRHATARQAVPVAVTVVALALLVVVGPVVGDMLNYGADVRMRTGGPSHVALFGGSPDGADLHGATQPSPGAGSAPPAVGIAYPADLVAGPIRGSLVTPGVLAVGAPWSSDPSSGVSRSVEATLPPPWTGPNRAQVEVYLPPGYDTDTTRRYPVVYSVPYNRQTWDRGMDFTTTMDGLITSAELPPMMVVFASSAGGPYVDPECSDSRDGREWFDRYVAKTLVPWADATFRTIATPAARTVMGSSRGGYCAASLITHHPDLFSNAISLSGYFIAGLPSSETIGADLVFGQDPAYERTQSPMLRVDGIAVALRRRLFVVMEADPAGHVFGNQMLEFAQVLDQAGVPEALFPTRLGHSWNGARAILPLALRLVAARQVSLGVFGAGG